MADNDLHDYRAMKDWLAGKKPHAQGRLWRRTLQRVVPVAIDRPLRKRLPGIIVDVLESTGVVVGLTVTGLVPLMLGMALFSLGNTMITPLLAQADGGNQHAAFVRELLAQVKGIAALFMITGTILFGLKITFFR